MKKAGVELDTSIHQIVTCTNPKDCTPHIEESLMTILLTQVVVEYILQRQAVFLYTVKQWKQRD